MLINVPGLLDQEGTITASSAAEWEELAGFIRQFFKFKESATSNAPKSDEGKISGNVPPANTGEAAGTSVKPTGHVGVTGTPMLPTEVTGRSWPERAWIELGHRPATGDEMYGKAVEMGYRSTALNPASAFKRLIRDNAHFKKVGERENRAVEYVLNPASNTPDHNSDNNGKHPSENSSSSQTKYGFSTPPGQRAVDFAKCVLEEVEHGLSINDLTNAMLEKGWFTTSPTPEKRGRSVAVALYGDKKQFVKRGTLWELTKWLQQERPALTLLDEPQESTNGNGGGRPEPS